LPLSELPISPISSPFKGLTEEEMEMVMNSSVDLLDEPNSFNGDNKDPRSPSSENKSESGKMKHDLNKYFRFYQGLEQISY